MIAPYLPEPELGPLAGGYEESSTVAIGRELNPTQQEQVRQVVAAFPTVLSARPGRTTVTSHHIATILGQKVRENHRPLPKEMRETVRKELESMLTLGVVEESKSEWRSPIVLVPKPDGSVRFCIDFRKVNAISRFDTSPMPRVDELLEGLGHAEFISTLDLTKGISRFP